MIIPDTILNSRSGRIELVTKNLSLFSAIYFSNYIKVPSAPFQLEIMKLLQDETIGFAVIVAFRNSGKSTLCAHIFPLWSILGKHKNHYVIIVCKNQDRARERLSNIRREFVRNQFLLNDFGPFHESGDPNNNDEIILGSYDAKIKAVSLQEGIRGTIFNSYRPDVIILDDIEDVQSTRTLESRDNIWQLVNAEILNLGAKDPRMIFIGNLVHNDSTMMRLKTRILSSQMQGVYREYPLLDEKDQPNWPGMYPTMKSVEDLRSHMGSEIDFLREFMLKVIPDGGQVIIPKMIHYYDRLPSRGFESEILVVDPAFSEDKRAAKTAIIRCKIYVTDDKAYLYVCPFPFNERRREPEVIEEIKRMYASSDRPDDTQIIVEKAGQQSGLIDMLIAEALPTIGFSIVGSDKRSRLSNSSGYIQSGRVLFPQEGAEELINQLLYFGVERYKDLVDAFTIGVGYFAKEYNSYGEDIGFVISY